MNNREILFPIFSQLAMAIDAGLPLVEALPLVARSAENVGLKGALIHVGEMVGSGETFADALSQYPDFFDNYCVALVKAGEMGGILDTIFNRLARDLEWEIRFERKIERALGTKVVADVYWLTTQLNNKISKAELDKLLLGMPNFGLLLLTVDMIRFCRTFATLIACGIPILDSFNVCIDIVHNETIKEALRTARIRISEGNSIADSLNKVGVFAAIFISMISACESTGTLDVSMEKIVDYLDKELDREVDNIFDKNL